MCDIKEKMYKYKGKIYLVINLLTKFPYVLQVRMEPVDETVVYTIRHDQQRHDAQLSFTEFIMSLRRTLANHRGQHEDVLDAHPHFENLAATQEHPLLARPHAFGPRRWIHVKLQVVDNNNIPYWTTLLIADYDVYLHGFKNQSEATYGITDAHIGGVCMLPKQKYNPVILNLDVTFASLLGTQDVVNRSTERRDSGKKFHDGCREGVVEPPK